MASSHSAEAQGVGVAHRAPFQEDRSGCTDYPLVLFLPELIVAVAVAHMGYEEDNGGDGASYASDEAGKRGDAEQPVEAAAQTQRREMR